METRIRINLLICLYTTGIYLPTTHASEVEGDNDPQYEMEVAFILEPSGHSDSDADSEYLPNEDEDKLMASEEDDDSAHARHASSRTNPLFCTFCKSKNHRLSACPNKKRFHSTQCKKFLKQSITNKRIRNLGAHMAAAASASSASASTANVSSARLTHLAQQPKPVLGHQNTIIAQRPIVAIAQPHMHPPGLDHMFWQDHWLASLNRQVSEEILNELKIALTFGGTVRFIPQSFATSLSQILDSRFYLIGFAITPKHYSSPANPTGTINLTLR